jgi:predicted transcriptional regulator
MGDKKKRYNTAIRFPDDVHRQLVEAAADHQVSINWLVNRAVAEFLPRLLGSDEVRWTRESKGDADG